MQAEFEDIRGCAPARVRREKCVRLLRHTVAP